MRYTVEVVIAVLLTIVHVIVCLFLIIVVLLQSGKAADLAGAFGGMGSQTAFGPRGSATLLSKATTISAIIFMLTSISLSIVATRTAGTSKTTRSEAPPGSEFGSGSSSTGACGRPKEIITNLSGPRKWRNWQTHSLEVAAPARAWGFKSPLPHQYRKKSVAALISHVHTLAA